MKVLMLNGSPRAKGNTATALAEMEKIFIGEGIAVETVRVGNLAVRGCVFVLFSNIFSCCFRVTS